jgi:hypothetical protein
VFKKKQDTRIFKAVFDPAPEPLPDLFRRQLSVAFTAA